MHITDKVDNMPVYEYICQECGNKFEIFRHFFDSDDDLECPVCGKKALVRQFSSINSTCSLSESSSH